MKGDKVLKRTHLALLLALLTLFRIASPLHAGELHDAARRGDLAAVRLLLKQGADVSAKDVWARDDTPLHAAAEAGKTDVAALLIEKSADVNGRNSFRQTPLHKAASKEIAELLIRKGADVNAPDEWQNTPLHAAAEAGKTGVALVLIQRGADVNAKGGFIVSALVRFAADGKDDVVSLLLARGADPNARDSYGGTALMWAAAHGHITTVKALLEGGADVNARDDLGRSALIDAARGNMPDIVRMFIAKGASVDAADKAGSTAWSYAAEKGFQDVAAILKAAGAKEAYDALNWSGQQSTVTKPEETAITSPSMWQAFWKNVFHTPPPLDIDFTRYIAACVFLGTRPTGGYGVEFGAPYEEGGRMVIPFRERKLAGFVTQAVTRPFAVKLFERKGDLAIVFKKEKMTAPR